MTIKAKLYVANQSVFFNKGCVLHIPNVRPYQVKIVRIAWVVRLSVKFRSLNVDLKACAMEP